MQAKTLNVSEDEDVNYTKQQKSARHRKKNYYNAIRKQMEFYFGDANLSKDRFLRQLIESDPYVPLDTFMTFNKIKTLAKSLEDIVKAVRKSEQLDLREDAAAVRRRAAIPAVHDADDKTIYVEQLPQDADHEWVIKAFGRFGKIAYVSLPKYKNSKKIKEFGFIEFEKDSSVRKAIRAFDAFDGVLGYETAAPDQLASVRSYLKEQKIEKEASGKLSSDDATDSESSSADSLEPPRKKFKVSDVDTPTSELEAELKPTKKRKHRKKSKFVAELDRDGVPDISQLMIATKKEWKRLRNKYLNLQREKMAELKRNMQSARGPKQARSYAPRLPIHRSPHNMNFYQDRNKSADKDNESADSGQDQKAGAKDKPGCAALKEQSTLHYESGLILHLRLSDPCVDVKAFKLEMRQYSEVKYVDVKEGAMEAHLRCESASSTQALGKRLLGADYSPEVLAGGDEEAYWNKIMQDRTDKFNKKVRVRTRRGREKISVQIPNHIRFGGIDD